METVRKFDRQFRDGAAHRPGNRETDRAGGAGARHHEGTLGNWGGRDRKARADGNAPLTESERAELNRLRRENAELAMERDVLRRSLWVKEAMGR